MNRRTGLNGLLASLVLPLAGCVAYGDPWVGPVHPGQAPRHYEGDPAPRHYSIPPGHMPPPGECRIWHPDRPPGHQPPPGDCYDLQRRVPPGAVLIRG